MQLTGQVAFVTGATGGIGSEICRSLVKEGANIPICYHAKYEEAQSLWGDITSLGREATASPGGCISKRSGYFCYREDKKIFRTH